MKKRSKAQARKGLIKITAPGEMSPDEIKKRVWRESLTVGILKTVCSIKA